MDRKEFLRAAFGAVAVVAGHPFTELSTATEATRVPVVVTATDIQGVRDIAGVFSSWDHAYGSGLVREAVNSQLRYSVELLVARCPQRLHTDLYSAVGFLGHVAASMAFDAYAHEDARKMFRMALACAEEVGDWHLRAKVLSTMARQAIWCGDPDTGLTLVELALVRADRLTAAERAMLLAARARALAKLGRTQETLSTIGMADEEFGRLRAGEEWPWMRYYDAAQHAGDTGHALFDLAVNGRFAGEASSRLSVAVAGHGDTYVRSRAFSGIKLASLTMVTGAPEEAAAIGVRALRDAVAVRSRRTADELRELH
ncbi:XRE family transcriptional regulator, partial [Streptomyces anulatus]|uniref:XRE family transcriptional regulator n=1 Tax=Streptomyces anulatus TaxID=1892 RepID=UPI00343781B0